MGYIEIKSILHIEHFGDLETVRRRYAYIVFCFDATQLGREWTLAP